MSEKLKVLTFCSWFPNRLKPTLGNFVQKHAECAALYNEVISLAIFPDTSIEKLEVSDTLNGSLREIVCYYPKKEKGWKPLRLLKNYLEHRRAFKASMELVNKQFGKPDIIHLNIVYPLGLWALWLKITKGIPYVITENSSGWHVTSEHAYPNSIRFLGKLVFRSASYILPVSENLKKNIQILAPKNKYALISNVVDEDLFQPQSVSTERFRFIHISTGVDEIKNLSGMIRVMAAIYSENQTIELDIVSDGDIEYARKLALELQLPNSHLRFHSTKTTAEVAAMIQASNALLMFSNYENFPCVIAEAMMCGKPVVSSNVNGIPEHVLPEVNGILVQPRDENALKNAMLTLAISPTKFDEKAIRTYAEKHFGYREVGKAFTEIYEKVVNKNN